MKSLDFPVLNANDIEVRVQNVKPDKGFSLLLYKTARTDAKYLDQVVGAFNWQDKYYLLNDTLYCSIGIYCEERKEWVWKDDCGSETAVEKEKGQSSDAYKRAGFRWGIGRELYSAPFIWVNQSEDNTPKGNYEVKSISYNENREIKSLEIINSKTGEVVYSFGVKGAKKTQEQKSQEKVEKKQEEIVDNESTMFDPHSTDDEDKPISKEHLSIIVSKYNSYSDERKERFMKWLKQEFHVATFEELTDKDAESVIMMAKMG